jgi:hypothetical protein
MTYSSYPVSGGGGSGDVQGPVLSVNNGVVLFDGTSGKTIKDLGVGSANQVLVTDGTTPSFALIADANVSGSAAIAYSKLALTNSIVNADINSGAAIDYSKLSLTGSIVNADINASAAIAYSKLNLSGSIVDADVSASAAIAYSKLNLSGSIVDADVSASAAIAYSKLNLTGSIVNADVSASAAIAYSKLNLIGSIVNADVSASAAIAYSKLNLIGSIVNADINASAAIDYSKMAALTASRALETDGSGFIVASAVTSTELGYVSGVTSSIQTQIDGKLSLTGGTLTGALTITPTTNQLVLGTTNTTTISATAPASSAVYTIPDAGANADFVMTNGNQTIAGTKSFSNDTTGTIQGAVFTPTAVSILNCSYLGGYASHYIRVGRIVYFFVSFDIAAVVAGTWKVAVNPPIASNFNDAEDARGAGYDGLGAVIGASGGISGSEDNRIVIGGNTTYTGAQRCSSWGSYQIK